MNNNLVNLCRAAFKTRKAVIGSQLIPSVQSKKVYIVIICESCGKNRRKKLEDKCRFYDIPCRILPESVFSQITPWDVQSFGISDKNLANVMIRESEGS